MSRRIDLERFAGGTRTLDGHLVGTFARLAEQKGHNVVVGETGLLVPPGDIGALADAIIALLDHRARAHGSCGSRR